MFARGPAQMTSLNFHLKPEVVTRRSKAMGPVLVFPKQRLSMNSERR